MSKVNFTKLYTRDFPLVLVEAWPAKFTEVMPKFFYGKCPERIFLYRKGAVECYQENKTLFQELPRDLSNWAKTPENSEELIKTFDNYVKCAQKLKAKTLEKTPHAFNELQEITRLFDEGMQELFPVYWCPAWHEKNLALFSQKIIQKAIKARHENDTFFDDATNLAYEQLYTIAREQYWPKNAVKFLLQKEINDALHHGERIDFNKIMQRSQGYAYIDDKLFTANEIPAALKKYDYELEEQNIQETHELIGTCANAGVAKGKATIIMNREELTKMREGDILVAPMTTPWYLPVMKKAAAIVTDEGGIMCHAAIVARELGIPCVIGTKHATKWLKDGDAVEVDAAKGIVKKSVN